MEPKVDRIFSSADAAEEGEMVNMEGPADIIVYLDNGEKFISSFFTCAGIQKMQKEHQSTGEYLGGTYYWTKRMIIVKDCSRETVERIVENLLEEGEFREAFEPV